MRNSVIYLTRRCVYDCDYCGIVDNTKKRKDELSLVEWQQAFGILERMGVEFNLVLGNEPWLLGPELPEIMNSTDIPYALYTTCQETLWKKYHKLYFVDRTINNLSIGVDIPDSEAQKNAEDSLKKSWNAWDAFKWVKENAPYVDTHATITVHRQNFRTIPKVISELDALGVYSNINFIHWNKDGKYDFFGRTERLQHLLFSPEDYPEIREVLDTVLDNNEMLQNPEMLHQDVERLATMGWHCGGSPYDGPTLNADGSLRVCGYRQGERTSKFSIFDLPQKEEEWLKAVYDDAMECPGCMWSCSWMYNHWKQVNPEKGEDIFIKHKVL